MENPIRIHDLGVPLFLETPISIQYMCTDCMYIHPRINMFPSQPGAWNIQQIEDALEVPY